MAFGLNVPQLESPNDDQGFASHFRFMRCWGSVVVHSQLGWLMAGLQRGLYVCVEVGKSWLALRTLPFPIDSAMASLIHYTRVLAFLLSCTVQYSTYSSLGAYLHIPPVSDHLLLCAMHRTLLDLTLPYCSCPQMLVGATFGSGNPG